MNENNVLVVEWKCQMDQVNVIVTIVNMLFMFPNNPLRREIVLSLNS